MPIELGLEMTTLVAGRGRRLPGRRQRSRLGSPVASPVRSSVLRVVLTGPALDCGVAGTVEISTVDRLGQSIVDPVDDAGDDSIHEPVQRIPHLVTGGVVSGRISGRKHGVCAGRSVAARH
ncbi:hypothetical protein CH296_01030 [Rhodococcus sp. 14-2496-1d]|nr:hypothetical protein CH296_01030 [Rhodococcus sp. 14-2496-1d]